MQDIGIRPCFSIYFSSWGLKKSTGLAKELLPVHSKSNIKSTGLAEELLPVHSKSNIKSTGLAEELLPVHSKSNIKSTGLAEELLPVHSKSNIKLNTNICLSLMHIIRKNSRANLKLIDNLIVSPDTECVYGELC